MSTSPNLVLVEGDDDLHLLLHLLNARGFEKSDFATRRQFVIQRGDESNRVEIKQKRGYETLLSELQVELSPRDLRRVAIIVDANGDPASRWRSLRDCLAKLGYAKLPGSLSAGGVVERHSEKPLGVWLMPDNRSPGFVEDFVRSMILEDELLRHAESSVESIPGQRRFPDAHVTKAYLHTWLAWQEEPGTRMAQALTKKYLTEFPPNVNAFFEWFDLWLATDSAAVQPTA